MSEKQEEHMGEVSRLPKTSEMLMRARALIETEDRWIKGANAKNTAGREIEPHDPFCWSLCAQGAVIRAVDRSMEWSTEIERLAMERTLLVHLICSARSNSGNPVMNLTSYNDHSTTTHDDIMKVFDMAIDRAKKMENSK